MGKFDLIVLLLDKNSILLDETGQNFSLFIQEYALVQSTLVVIYICEKVNRIISGQQAYSMESLPGFDDSDGRNDAASAIKSWVYEAQAIINTDNTVMLRTGIFADVGDDQINAHYIDPADILGNLKETEYFQYNRISNTYDQMRISKIAKLEALAKEGDEKALYELGLAYITGEDAKKDEPKAQMLLYKAYLRGYIDAIFALVDLFYDPPEHFRKEAAKHR